MRLIGKPGNGSAVSPDSQGFANHNAGNAESSQPGQLKTEPAQPLARGGVIGLWIGLRLVHAVEEQPALARDVVANGEMQDRLAALLDRLRSA